MSNIRKEKIEAQIESLENKRSKPQAVIKDLVASFLIPNIQKNKLQKKSKMFFVMSSNEISCFGREKIR